MLKLAAPTLTAFALTSATSCTPAPAPTHTPSEPIERVERLLDESDNALRSPEKPDRLLHLPRSAQGL